ncbi:hypothetical protein [Ruegeria sp. HKCCE4150]|uniref:hypothetical protein n=1 Tax=Ruegeria sp. HKCCE4150 TaxID=2794828 RepID=UPI001AE5754F|nr:hypothetical protein [Ruegeria sp. HKCCE4150]
MNLIKAISVTLLFVSNVAHGAEYEEPPVLGAQNTVQDVPLSTEIYSIEEQVPTDGFMATYRIETQFGQFLALGPGMLQARLTEIRALAALDHIQNDQQFIDAAEETAGETFENLRQFAKQPKETLKGVPEGIGRFFKRTGRSAKTGLQKLGDVREGNLPGVDPESVSNLPGGSADQQAGPQGSFTENVARAGGDVAVNILGFDKQRRRLAKELGVDPYTTNQLLAARLDEVTWAAFAGGLGINVLTSLVPGGLILSSSSRLSDWVWDTAPGDLRVQVGETLLSIGVPRDQVDRFLRHSYYTLSMQAVVADSLRSLEGVQGRAETLPLILSVGSEGQARFLVQTLDMFRTYHMIKEPLSQLQVQGTIIGIGSNGISVVMAPVDYLSWTETLDTFSANLTEVSEGSVALYVSGEISSSAKDNLISRDWIVEETGLITPDAFPLR